MSRQDSGHLRVLSTKYHKSSVLLTIPTTADIVATKSALNKKVEWMAARLRALTIVLPEAGEYLVARLKKQRVLTIVGGDQA